MSPEVPPVSGAGRRSWRVAAAAAAVLVVVGGAGLLASRALQTDRSAPPTQPSSAADPLPAPSPGWRWVSWRDVAVQVPESWGYGVAPMLPWCMYDSTVDVERAPYVAQDTSGMGIALVGCAGNAPDGHPEPFGPAPARFWAPHVSFGETTSGVPDDQMARFRDWSLTSREVGEVRVVLLADPETASLTGRILDSARTFGTDQFGCAASSPVQEATFARPEPFDVASVERVDSISVCQYSRGIAPDRPGLMGSRLLVGSAASGLLDAIRRAPFGGGPDTPQTCAQDLYGDTGIALRLHSGDVTREVYVYYDWCFGNGFDDGTERRELTRDSCLPLFGGNVAMFGGSSGPFRRCHA